MKAIMLTSFLLVILLFANPLTATLPTNRTEVEIAPLVLGRSDTLLYDDGTFTGGLGFYTSTGVVNPEPDSNYGFGIYFILSQFGLANQKIVSILLYFGPTINHPEYNFRLYVWNNRGTTLYPQSEGPYLYRNQDAVLPPVETWGEFDLSASNITLPDTFWIGVNYNHLSTNTDDIDWYLAMNDGLTDNHMYLNDMDDAIGWVTAGTWGYGYPFGVRVVVEDAGNISERYVLTPGHEILRVPTIINGSIDIAFTLNKTTKVELSLYSALGRICQTLVSKEFSAGTHHHIQKLNLEPGVYFLNFKTDSGKNITKKIIFCR